MAAVNRWLPRRRSRTRRITSAENTHAYYLRDLGFLLREQAEAAKQAAESTSGDERAFKLGVVWTYYSVLDLMLQQAEGFDLPASDLALKGFDPDKLLST